MAKLLRNITPLKESKRNPLAPWATRSYSTQRLPGGTRLTTTMSGKKIGRTTMSKTFGSKGGTRTTFSQRGGSTRVAQTQTIGGITYRKTLSPYKPVSAYKIPKPKGVGGGRGRRGGGIKSTGSPIGDALLGGAMLGGMAGATLGAPAGPIGAYAGAAIGATIGATGLYKLVTAGGPGGIISRYLDKRRTGKEFAKLSPADKAEVLRTLEQQAQQGDSTSATLAKYLTSINKEAQPQKTASQINKDSDKQERVYNGLFIKDVTFGPKHNRKMRSFKHFTMEPKPQKEKPIPKKKSGLLHYIFGNVERK